jgi:plasmid stabilization system protein ParE
MIFELLIDYRAQQDIEEALDYYMSKSVKVANKFYTTIEETYYLLE